MSRLKELMAELCPDGVEYKSLKSVLKTVKKINWDNQKGSLRYIDLSSVDREQHEICDTIERL